MLRSLRQALAGKSTCYDTLQALSSCNGLKQTCVLTRGLAVYGTPDKLSVRKTGLKADILGDTEAGQL